MSVEDMDITLENLLNLALGNPEIGAVNFNFLHEVISEILKHLGISNKLARVTQELDFRLSQNYNPLQNVAEENRTQSPVPQKLPTSLRKTAPNSATSIATKSDHAEPNQQVDRQPINSSHSPPPPYESDAIDGAPAETQSQQIPTSSVTPPPNEPSNLNQQHGGQDSMTDIRSVPSVSTSKSRQHIPAPPSSHSRKSSLQASVHAKRSSILTSRYSAVKGASPSFNDAVVSRTLERGNSQTPAGDMWHVLNINRRVEAAEAAIQGMTNLIDNINSDLYEMRSNNSSDVIRTQSPSLSKNLDSTVDEGLIQSMMNELDSKMNQFEQQLAKLVTKEQVQELCTADTVNDMIKENLEAFESGISTEAASTSKRAVTPKPHNPSTGSEKDSGLEDALAKTTTSVKSIVSLKRRDSRESRTRVAYQEVSAKMLYLEQEINKAKGHVNSLEVLLGSKIELSDIDGKLDKTDFQKARDELNKQIKNAYDQISALENSHKTVGKEVSALVSQTDGFTIQQRQLAKSMQKLERDLEDMTDNFHRSQTNMAQKKSNDGLDEAAINKIRGNIFDIQEQQSKFQQDLDFLSQDSKNKYKLLDNVNVQIKELQDTKVDKEFVEDKVAGKVDNDAIMDKVDRDHFDACVRDLDANFQNILQKIDGTEAFTNQKVNTLEGIIHAKVDRDDIKEIHAYIDQRFKAFKPKVQQKQRAEETAAGTKKQLIKNCNCISCDRPVEMTTGGDEIITLPYYQALPGVKSMRPINTFDLQTLRQHMHQTLTQGSNRQRYELSQERNRLQKELLQLCGVRDLDEFAVAAANRACGGEHTLIEQHRRNPTKNSNGYRDDQGCYGNEPQLETEVRGRDGHIYKGRIQSPHLPDIRKTMPPITDQQTEKISQDVIPHHPSSAENQHSNYTSHRSEPIQQ